jgi:hypothetical protein
MTASISPASSSSFRLLSWTLRRRMPGVDARLDPVDRGQRHLGVVLQPAAHVGDRGLRPLRNADPPALEVGGRPDRRMFHDVDRAVAEHPRREHRQRDHCGVALRAQRAVGGQRELGNFPFLRCEKAVRDLLERQVEHPQLDAFRLDAAGRQLARVQVVADRERQGKVGHEFSASVARRPGPNGGAAR